VKEIRKAMTFNRDRQEIEGYIPNQSEAPSFVSHVSVA
jgi:hypothetical protein